jgi:hypothetical protein
MLANALPFTHVAYADETKYNKGAFPGIALVSLSREDAAVINEDVADILTQSKVDEFKWEKLYSAKRRFAAIRLIDYVVERAAAGQLRVDVLTWDLRDGRHTVPRPDKIANLQRMYYHLFRNVLRARWPDAAVWRLCPDEHSAIAWQEIQGHLERHSTVVQADSPLLTGAESSLHLHTEFHIHEILPCHSHKMPLVQVADLFVGMGSYSRSSHSKVMAWQRQQKEGQLPLVADDTIRLSHRDRERCQVIVALNEHCKRRRLGVSLATYKGLRTLNPSLPINFWWYVPQSEEDKAPVRNRRPPTADR